MRSLHGNSSPEIALGGLGFLVDCGWQGLDVEHVWVEGCYSY